jgi:exodeoxyribonuclease V alpha subunit
MLAPEQRAAVKSALASRLCIISGGPGTGKTLIQSVLLKIYADENPEAKIVCCAPTGRAARRMEQCTGYPASTIHKALGLFAGDDGEYGEAEELDADLVLVDEVSMLDIYLARHLLNALPADCKLILVGDADQLPSVGPGAVLSETYSLRAHPGCQAGSCVQTGRRQPDRHQCQAYPSQ